MNLTELRIAQERRLAEERTEAAARGEEHAVPCPGFPAWDAGAPYPHVLRGARGVVLVYLVREPTPGWDGTSVRIVDVTNEEEATVAVVHFEHVTAVRMGSPNDEVLDGHRLHGKGLDPYEAHTVVHSAWLDELRTVNAVHPQYDATHWTRYHHYFLAFHDEVFECIASGFRVEVKRTALAKACRDALEQVLGTA